MKKIFLVLLVSVILAVFFAGVVTKVSVEAPRPYIEETELFKEAVTIIQEKYFIGWGLNFFDIRTEISIGRGIVLEKEYVFTPAHILRWGKKNIYLFYDNEWIPLQLLKIDKKEDLAILKPSQPLSISFPLKRFGNPDTIKEFEKVYYIGFKGEILDQKEALKTGLMLGGMIRYPHRFQFVVQEIVEGESGSPIFDRYGRLIGLVLQGLEVPFQNKIFFLYRAVKIDIIKSLIETID